TNTEAIDEAIINEELLPLIIDFPNADLPSGNIRTACAARLVVLDNRNNELQLQDNVTLNKYTTKLEQSFQNNTLFIKEVLNLEAQKLIKELEEFSYEEDDNFSNESLIDEEDKDTVMSLNEENTNWEINDVIGFDEE
ncbi:15704_t:CDS:1, partial [Funneliformis mosseae]